MPVQAVKLQRRASSYSAHHVYGIPHRQSQVLVLFFLGLSTEEAAACIGVKLDTLTQHAQRARYRVVPPTDEPTRFNAQFWAGHHLKCCLASACTEFALAG
jgi:hypothetical protein